VIVQSVVTVGWKAWNFGFESQNGSKFSYKIPGFHYGVIWGLRYSGMLRGCSLPKFRDSMSNQSAWVRQCKKIGLLGPWRWDWYVDSKLRADNLRRLTSQNSEGHGDLSFPYSVKIDSEVYPVSLAVGGVGSSDEPLIFLYFVSWEPVRLFLSDGFGISVESYSSMRRQTGGCSVTVELHWHWTWIWRCKPNASADLDLLVMKSLTAQSN
jgi:hypothetical protein